LTTDSAIPIEHILGKLPVVPVGDTGTIPHHLHNVFPGAPRRPDAGDGCRCGLSTLGPWAGPVTPVICNEWNGSTQHGERFRQWDHAALYYCYYSNDVIGTHINIANNKKYWNEIKIIQIIISQKKEKKYNTLGKK
jgi:hypothetical protein